MKRSRWFVLPFGALLLMGGGIVAAQQHATAQATPMQITTNPPPSSYISGGPAIPVPSTASTTSSVPPITMEDVRTYAQAQKGTFRGSFIGLTSIASIRLMSLNQVREFLNDQYTVLSHSPLYYVVVFNNGADFPAPEGTSNTTRNAYEVFDAYTGNLLVAGGNE